jgi:transposase
MARRSGLPSQSDFSIQSEVAHLRDLDLKGLQARWRRVFRKQAPEHLPRHVLIGVLAFQLQAEAWGDIDAQTRRVLDLSGVGSANREIARQLEVLDQRQSPLNPGTILKREWQGRQHRVMVLTDGFAWNGKTYASLSKLATAMTGTNCNGPRFFGLRGKSASRGAPA